MADALTNKVKVDDEIDQASEDKRVEFQEERQASQAPIHGPDASQGNKPQSSLKSDKQSI